MAKRATKKKPKKSRPRAKQSVASLSRARSGLKNPQNAQARIHSALAGVVERVRRLRAPDGCPWDLAQTHQTLRPYLIEEAYELLDVLDGVSSEASLREPARRADFVEELGDVLLQVLLHAEMAGQAGAFDLGDVARALDEKLYRRHPHVFAGETFAGERAGKGAKKQLSKAEISQQWELVKAEEKAKKGKRQDQSILSGLPANLPALQRAGRVIEKVTKVGFQWPDFQGPLAKLEEEVGELKVEIERFAKLKQASGREPSKASTSSGADLKSVQARLEAELGDVMFCVANLAFLLGVEPEQALRGNLKRFEGRFRFVETELAKRGKRPEQSSLEEMDRYWDEAKRAEKKRKT